MNYMYMGNVGILVKLEKLKERSGYEESEMNEIQQEKSRYRTVSQWNKSQK